MTDWETEEWRAQATAWMDARLDEHGIARTGPVEQPRVRPWATVLRAETSGGVVWMKACGPENAFEAGLYEVLEAAAPKQVLAPLGVDAERAWLLLPDGGAPIGERLEGEALVSATAEALPAYGRLQRAVAPHTERLLELGVADMRAPRMPERFEQATEGIAPYGEPSLMRRLTGSRGRVVEWSERLAAAPVDPSVDHNDLHGDNILTGNRFYDWGDAVIAHPFASMLVPLTMQRRQDGTQTTRLRNAYLEAFADLATRRELEKTLELACHVGKIARTLTWLRAIEHFDPAERLRWAKAPVACMTALLDDDYLGGT